MVDRDSPSSLTTTPALSTIVLRAPQAVRGHRGRAVPPPMPLLPVFVAGEENRFAAFVANLSSEAFADEVSQPSVNGDGDVSGGGDGDAGFGGGLGEFSPLLLVGPPGTGKSVIAIHLATKLLDGSPAGRVATGAKPRDADALVMPGIDFARFYARAVDADEVTRFRRDVDHAAVLVIDDVHLMVGKAASQEELAARIESRTAAGRPTILTARRLPPQVAGLRPLLVSRMLPGLTVPLRPPGTAARRYLLTEFTRRRDMTLGSDELHLLEAGLARDLPVRQLDAAIAGIDLYCRMKGCTPDVHAVRAALAAVEPAVNLSTEKVAKLISRRYKLKLSDLKSGTRRQEVVRARSLAMFLSRQLTGSSYHQIGKYFGGRDHTTVLHACRKTETLIGQDSDLRVTADELIEQLKATA